MLALLAERAASRNGHRRRRYHGRDGERDAYLSFEQWCAALPYVALLE